MIGKLANESQERKFTEGMGETKMNMAYVYSISTQVVGRCAGATFKACQGNHQVLASQPSSSCASSRPKPAPASCLQTPCNHLACCPSDRKRTEGTPVRLFAGARQRRNQTTQQLGGMHVTGPVVFLHVDSPRRRTHVACSCKNRLRSWLPVGIQSQPRTRVPAMLAFPASLRRSMHDVLEA